MPRSAAELRAAAVATGWFDGPALRYVGDGYSIPWELGTIVAPGFGGSLYIWKQFLDANYLEPSRLHDWLYTPYGKDLIGADQVESDLALRDEMTGAGADLVQVALVYRACQLGGSPYFGRSSVGYVQPILGPTGRRDIGVAGQGRIGTMANWKVVMMFQASTEVSNGDPTVGYEPVARTAGWTESYYDVGTQEEVLTRLKGPRTDGPQGIAPSRAAMLPSTATLLAARLYQIGIGKGQPFALNLRGGTWVTDVPSMSLLMQTSLAATPSTRRFMARCIPDSQVEKGEYAPSTNFSTAVRFYTESLTNTNVYGRQPGVTHNAFSITTNGHVVLRDPHTYAQGQIVYIKNALTTEGRRRGGEYIVSGLGPLNTEFTVAGWLWGDCTGGTVTQVTYGFFVVGIHDTKVVRITNRKVGRPFAGYRGRSSKRKAK